jgi:hypothetical protein
MIQSSCAQVTDGADVNDINASAHKSWVLVGCFWAVLASRRHRRVISKPIGEMTSDDQKTRYGLGIRILADFEVLLGTMHAGAGYRCR